MINLTSDDLARNYHNKIIIPYQQLLVELNKIQQKGTLTSLPTSVPLEK